MFAKPNIAFIIFVISACGFNTNATKSKIKIIELLVLNNINYC